MPASTITTTTALSTDLNSLPNGAAALSAAISTDADVMELELVVTFGVAPSSTTRGVDVYLVRTVDGANFEDGATAGPILPPNGAIGSFVCRAVTTAQRIVIPDIPVPYRDFKVLVVNNTGQAMAASGNAVNLSLVTLG